MTVARRPPPCPALCDTNCPRTSTLCPVWVFTLTLLDTTMASAGSSAWTRRTGSNLLLKRNPNLFVDRQGENNAVVRARVRMVRQRFHYPIGAVVDFVAQLLVAFDNVGTQLLGNIRP